MRFRFCWDVDCPDWLLAEIATLSKLTSVKLRVLAGTVAKSCYGDPLKHDVITKLANDTKISEAEGSACAAAIRWVLESGAGAGVSAGVLDSELQQLGLPREHASALTRVYTSHLSALSQHLRDCSLRVGGGTEMSCRVVGVDVGGGGDGDGRKVEAVVQLKVVEEGRGGTHNNTTTLALTPTQLYALIHELSEAKRLMESMS